jgi:hypothetical protein
MRMFHKPNATGLTPWLCATTLPLLAFSCASLGARQPPWDGCRAASKTEYESAKEGFFAANERRRVCNDWPLVATLLLVLPLIIAARNSALQLASRRALAVSGHKARDLLAPVYGS